MTNANQQILTLAKQGFTAQEIVENYGYELDQVVLVLEQNVAVLKNKEDNDKAIKLIDKEFGDCLPIILSNMKMLALTSDDPRVRFQATSFIIEQQCGMKRPAKGSVNNTFNIVQLSENIKRARAAVSNRAAECGIEPPVNMSLVSI